jgi:hypothetical protein
MAANYLIVNETYDPPTQTTPGGWQDGNVAGVSRQYVKQGVCHSTALQVSGTLVGPDYCDIATALFQTGVMGGNELATRENTVLSFDIKIDQPGLSNVDVLLDAFDEYLWNYGDPADAHYTSSVGTIALGHYKPGVFKRIVLPLDDPRLVQNDYPDPNNMPPLFNPSARTYNNVTVTVTSGSFATLPASFTITVDNVQITTRSAMIPFEGFSVGVVRAQADGSFIATECGVAEPIGFYKQTITIPADGTPASFELTAAHGAKLVGAFIFGGNDYGEQILKGTGCFHGVVGSYRALITWGQQPDPATFPYTATLLGGISTSGPHNWR